MWISSRSLKHMKRLTLFIPVLLIVSLLFLRNPPPRQRIESHIHTQTSSVCNPNIYPQPWELRWEQLTVLINGFSESRLPLLQKLTRAYSAMPCVHSIYILWANHSTASHLLQSQTFDSLGSPIYILRQPSPSLNDRFLPRDFISTRAVVVCDDDVEIDAAALCFAHRVWAQHGGTRIVGFFARSHVFELETSTWMYTVHSDRYSIVLTKLMIVATEFLYLYTCHIPAGVREHVDGVNNCEDIAMNFLVADRTRAGPILVEGNPRDYGDTRNSEETSVVDVALSGHVDHRKRRGGCITQFHRLWGRMPLRYSYGVVAPTVREQGLCVKSGVLLPCDQVASSNPGSGSP